MPALGIEIKRKCLICGKVFIIKTLGSIYCSTKCSKVAYKGKKDAEKEEAERLAMTPCENEVLKRAFFFALLTGIRLCDIQDMKWSEIIQTDNGWRVDFTQRKTKVVDYLPISDQAYALCGERKEHERRVFEGLTGSSWILRPLKKWIAEAGITKKITFHCPGI